MYAVIETGGKQYRVEVGTELEVELLDVEPGQTITLDRVLLVADGDDVRDRPARGRRRGRRVPRSFARPAATKLISFKYRPKARSRVKKGHRQELTVLRISDIVLGGKSAAEADGEGQGRREDRAPAPRGGRRRARPPRTPRSPRSSRSAPRPAEPQGQGRDRQGRRSRRPPRPRRRAAKADAAAKATPRRRRRPPPKPTAKAAEGHGQGGRRRGDRGHGQGAEEERPSARTKKDE